MFYCYYKNHSLFEVEQKLAREQGSFICYDKKLDQFFDVNDNVIDISGLLIFVRAGAYVTESLIQAVEAHGGISYTKIEDIDKVLSWPNYIKTRRHLLLTNGFNILNNPDFFKEFNLIKGIFFKTKKKNYANNVDIYDLFSSSSSFMRALSLHEEDEFIVSDKVCRVVDENGPLEFRAFVIDGQIINISRIHDSLYHMVSDEVIATFQSKVWELLQNGFPKSFTIDIFMCYENGEKFYDIVECNPIESSYPYIYNSILGKYDLSHQNPMECIPLEKKLYADTSSFSFSSKYEVEHANLVGMKDSFARDYQYLRFHYVKEEDLKRVRGLNKKSTSE